MLFFIGGAARTGKGILTRRLLVEQNLPFLSLDVLKMGLTRGMPQLAFDPDAGGLQVAQQLWPLVREMCHSLLRDGVDYVFEGELLPALVAGLRQEYPAQVKACFLGYSEIAPDQKMREIREHSGHPNDWPQEHNDADLLAIINREIAFSRFLQAECARVDFPYFDVSHDFIQALDVVASAIRDAR